jgi:hypothetical protein
LKVAGCVSSSIHCQIGFRSPFMWARFILFFVLDSMCQTRVPFTVYGCAGTGGSVHGIAGQEIYLTTDKIHIAQAYSGYCW